MATPASGAEIWLTINDKPLSFRPNDENEALNISEYSDNTIEITNEAPKHITIVIDEEPLITRSYGIWTWRPEHYAGLYRLIVQAPGHEARTAWVRVFPHKFSQRLYKQMKEELAAISLELWFRLDSPAIEKTDYARRLQETSPLHDYKHIHAIVEKMRDVMLHIRSEPYFALHTQSFQRNWHEVAHFSNGTSPLPGACLELAEQAANGQGIRYLPQRWSVHTTSPTYDVYENRLLKHFLQKQLVARLSIIQERAKREAQWLEPRFKRYHNQEDGDTLRSLQRVVADCQQMKQRCMYWSSEEFLKTVQPVVLAGKATQVLLKHPAYSRFFRLYLLFQQRLKTASTERYVNELALRKVSELYEMWSVFVITRMAIDVLLTAGYRMVSNTTFYEVEKNYFQFDVRRNVASIVLTKDDLRVEFKYEPVYPNQSTVRAHSALVATIIGDDPLTPDMAIEVYKNGEPQDILVFDAKYRRRRARNGLFYPNQEDLDKMHRYRDNIQYQRYHPERSRQPYTLDDIVSSAYILYPGNNIHTESNGKIGALPLIPNLSPQRLDDIREQLKDLLYYAYLID
jgi:predicted component of viral defense system (DUF524 family)